MENLGDIGSRIRSSLLWNTSLKVLYQIFRFGITIIIARLLDPKDFGIMGISTMIVFYANSITNFGFNLALIQRKEINDRHINSVFTVNILISLVLMMGVISLSSPIAKFFLVPELENVLLVLSWVFVMTSFYQLPLTLMKREINFKKVAMIELCCGVVQSLVTLTLALLGFKYWSLVVGLMTSYVFGVILLL